MALEITQGDYERANTVLLNLDELPADHPLKAAGLQTSGYFLRLVAKRSPSRPDSEGLVLGPERFSVLSPTEANIEFLPEDSLNLPISDGGDLWFYDVQISNADGTRVFTIEPNAEIFIKRHIAIAAP